MKNDKYAIRSSKSFLRYRFYSDGPKGIVVKQVQYKKIDKYRKVYNLEFGDLNQLGEVDDLIVTNNGDVKKVLATVAFTMVNFFGAHPTKLVFIMGSTVTRTRLYRIAISTNLEELSSKFDILGLRSLEWQPFEKNTDYSAFLFRLKKVNL